MKQIAKFLDRMVGRVVLFGFGFFAGVSFVGLLLLNGEIMQAVIDAEMNEREADFSVRCDATEFGSTRCRLAEPIKTQTDE